MAKYLVISCSLSTNSQSRLLARAATEALQAQQQDCELVDLDNYPNVPLCDAGSCYEDPTVIELNEKVDEADGILLASPIYNYDVNSAAKTLIELTGQKWANKVVGLMVTAGGNGSLMGPLSFLNSLMLDFRCVILPKYVYATGAHFNDRQISDPDINERITHLTQMLVHFTTSLKLKDNPI